MAPPAHDQIDDDSVTGRAKARLHDVAGYARDTVDDARELAGESYAVAREKASQVRRAAADEIDANPLALIAGGIALGAIIGSLLPRSDREAELLAPAGGRLADAAQQAFSAAKDAGRGKLDELGLTKDSARGQLDRLIQGFGDVARTAGGAAAGAVRDRG